MFLKATFTEDYIYVSVPVVNSKDSSPLPNWGNRRKGCVSSYWKESYMFNLISFYDNIIYLYLHCGAPLGNGYTM